MTAWATGLLCCVSLERLEPGQGQVDITRDRWSQPTGNGNGLDQVPEQVQPGALGHRGRASR